LTRPATAPKIARSQWAVSSAVEHCLHTAGVTSSILVPPTNRFEDLGHPTGGLCCCTDHRTDIDFAARVDRARKRANRHAQPQQQGTVRAPTRAARHLPRPRPTPPLWPQGLRCAFAEAVRKDASTPRGKHEKGAEDAGALARAGQDHGIAPPQASVRWSVHGRLRLKTAAPCQL
jgi:hypothetical protein